jgi:hypothetical protein
MLCHIKRHEQFCIQNPECSKLKKCKQCNKEFVGRYKKFCCSTCSAIFNNTGRKHLEKTKSKISKSTSISIKKKWVQGDYNHIAKVSPIFTSKNECEIVYFFKNNFPADEWKSGGNLKFTETDRLSRDLYSDKLKVCFEYDGIWHFEDIHGQLTRKQTKDILLKNWCRDNNYRLVRVDEDSYIDCNQIVDLIYNRTDPVILIGTRY